MTPYREPKDVRELRVAAERRHAFRKQLVAKKPPKEALDLILLALIQQQLDYGELDLENVCVTLGLVDDPGEDGIDENVDLVVLLREFARRGPTELQRAAVMVAFDLVDSGGYGYGGIDTWLQHGSQSYVNTGVAREYLELLRANGYELAPIETKRLAATTDAPAEAAA